MRKVDRLFTKHRRFLRNEFGVRHIGALLPSDRRKLWERLREIEVHEFSKPDVDETGSERGEIATWIADYIEDNY